MSSASRLHTPTWRRILGGVQLVAFCVASLAALPSAPTLEGSLAQAKKAKKAKTSAASVEQAKKLEDQGQGVMQCAVKKALDKGVSKVEVDVSITINNRGQVVGVVINAQGDKKAHKELRDCIDSLLRGVQFPPGEAPLTTLQRQWEIS